jgi:hypothetical protein
MVESLAARVAGSDAGIRDLSGNQEHHHAEEQRGHDRGAGNEDRLIGRRLRNSFDRFSHFTTGQIPIGPSFLRLLYQFSLGVLRQLLK